MTAEVLSKPIELPHVFPNMPRILGPREYEALRAVFNRFPALKLEEWDDSLPLVFKKYPGMYPWYYMSKLVEVLGKRKKKLKIRYAPVKEEHEGYHCTSRMEEWVFYGGRVDSVLEFYFVFHFSKLCGLLEITSSDSWSKIVRVRVDLETGEVNREHVWEGW